MRGSSRQVIRSVFSHLLAALLVSSALGCTFYTACPNGGAAQGNNNPGGGTSAGGGSGGGSVVGSGGSPVSGSWTNTTNNLASVQSECGNMSFVSAKPDEDLLIAGIAQAGLWASTDGGDSWKRLGQGKGSDEITNRTSTIVYDPEDAARFWESGLYNGGGVYETKDDGKTFKQLGSVMHSDLVSVDLSDPDRQTLVAGGHEAAQTVNLSTDGGLTWAPIGSLLPPDTNCTNPHVIDAKTFLVGCGGYGGGVTGIYGTTDAGKTWTELTKSGGASAPLLASDGSIYWASPNGAGLTRSTDQGETWTDVVGSGVLRGLAPIELPDGRIAALGRAVIVSADQGATWTEVTPPLPYDDVSGLAYSPQEKAFYVWHFSCSFPSPIPLPTDAIMKFEFDFASQ